MIGAQLSETVFDWCAIKLTTAQEILEDYMLIFYVSVTLEISASLKGNLWNKCSRTNLLVKKAIIHMTTYFPLDTTTNFDWHVNDFSMWYVARFGLICKILKTWKIPKGECENFTKSRKTSPIMSWRQHERHMIAIWTPFGHHMNATWLPYECHMNTTWTPHDCYMNNTWLQHEHHMIAIWMPWLTYECHDCYMNVIRTLCQL